MQPAEGFALSSVEPDGTPFDALFRAHYPRVVGLLARLMGDRGQAEEIAADVFCKISRKAGTGQNADGWVPWLYRVATNAGLDALRSNSRRRRREEVAGRWGLHNSIRSSALDRMLHAERCERVRSVLLSLKPRDAQLLLLRVEGLAYRDLADALGVQPASIGTLLSRAEAEFSRRFRARFGDEL